MSRRLEMRQVTVAYGEVEGLKNLSLAVERGEVVALLGANGAGKSTALKAIMSMVQTKKGAILIDGKDVTGAPIHMAARSGVALVPEGRRVFKRMSVRENLDVGAVTRDAAEATVTRSEVYALFPRLKEREAQLAGTLSGGEQQMLAIGRALMAKPDFILFDEPSLGLAPLIVDSVMDVIRRVSGELGIGGILVEQNVEVALSVASRALVLTRGELVLSGTSDEVRESPTLRNAYLGLTQ